MTGGSQQLRAFRRAIRSGATVEAASEASGIPLAEARLHYADMIENPPAPEDFEPIAPIKKELPMPRGRTARAPKDDDAGEIKMKDFALAKKLYLHDIKPAISKQGEFGQEASTAYKALKKQCHIQPGAARTAFKYFETEDSKADDWARGFVGLVNELCGRTVFSFHSNDLVDIAEGKTEVRPKPKLVTLPGPPDDDSDLAGDTFDEATEEELAMQEGRVAPTEADA